MLYTMVLLTQPRELRVVARLSPSWKAVPSGGTPRVRRPSVLPSTSADADGGWRCPRHLQPPTAGRSSCSYAPWSRHARTRDTSYLLAHCIGTCRISKPHLKQNIFAPMNRLPPVRSVCQCSFARCSRAKYVRGAPPTGRDIAALPRQARAPSATPYPCFRFPILFD